MRQTRIRFLPSHVIRVAPVCITARIMHKGKESERGAWVTEAWRAFPNSHPPAP